MSDVVFDVMADQAKAHIVSTLKADLLRLQGLKVFADTDIDFGLDPLYSSFPNKAFPLGCIHEFLTPGKEALAATGGFISGILNVLMANKGATVWISAERIIYPPALKNFGLDAHRIIFIDAKNDADAMWVMDEALKCEALSAVICEIKDLSFTASRRLQLAVEDSNVTGFVLRKNCSKVNPTACVSRWKITHLPSYIFDDLPGIGITKWRVELIRMRNGKPGVWKIGWHNGRFEHIESPKTEVIEQTRKAG